ncbi:MAG TPA: TnpV protein [Ruminococcaceae bacterium]|nr:TnpV protein [Oscillospiraceae bacterium]
MKDEFVKNIGVWGQRHYAYLKKHSPTVINVMRMKGTLEQYLRDIDQDAQEMFDLLMKQYAEIESITEQLKAENQMDWVCKMNNIRDRINEIIYKELIYV